MRKKYLDCELPPQLLAGAEGRATQISYTAQDSGSTAAYPRAKSKHKLFSMDRLNAMDNKLQKGALHWPMPKEEQCPG